MALALGLSDECLAQSVKVETVDCVRGVHLTAHAAPASEVLRQLARSQNFKLTIESRMDQLLTVDITEPTHELLTSLFDDQNLVIKQRRDPRCAGRYRVARVWIVKSGTRSSAMIPPVPKAPAQWTVTPEAREQDDLYRRAHGMPPEPSASQPGAQ
jgi:hypothetical protein